ncbi:hypothetical protein JOF55_002001 [Haloactinomyces albus]|uniref:Uncharacterized protein n=1 Tax=Haloactinomyces albus TaxID=1352928 RepID=A0AAE3ZDG0_9ACTN|nr:hypothetical protein [Haloactinomyces albus]
MTLNRVRNRPARRMEITGWSNPSLTQRYQHVPGHVRRTKNEVRRWDHHRTLFSLLNEAEAAGFEPADPLGSLAFKIGGSLFTASFLLLTW